MIVNDSAEQAVPTAAVPELAAALPVSRAASSEQRLGLDVACAAAGQAELVPQKISATGDDQVTTVLYCLLGSLHLTQFGSVDICHRQLKQLLVHTMRVLRDTAEPCRD